MRGIFIIIVFLLFTACKTSQDQAVVVVHAQGEEKEIIDSTVLVEKAHLAHKAEMTELIFVAINSPEYKQLFNVYKKNQYAPFWVNDSLVKGALNVIENAVYHGFDANQYNFQQWYENSNLIVWDSLNAKQLIKLELGITGALRQFAIDLLNGILNPKDFHYSWNYKKTMVNIDAFLSDIILNGKLIDFDSSFEPKTTLYQKLKQELKYLIRDTLFYSSEVLIDYPGFTLRKGDSNEYVLPIKRKLLNVHNDSNISMAFDEKLHNAVLKFQQQHGLSCDGILGRNSYGFANFNRQDYINTIKVNLERLRWFSNIDKEKCIVINIPSYTLSFFSDQSLSRSHKVVVGKNKHQTPVFQSALNYIVYNPCWTVPNSIATKSMLPRLQNDPDYLINRNMFIRYNGQTVDADTIDFFSYSKHNFPFKIFQNTGPGNALGKVKFMFDNPYSIYMHDTPSKSYFNKELRAFSHGCIRLQNAMDFAAFILHDFDKQTTPISSYTKKSFPVKVYLNNPIPYNIQYITCSLNEKDSSIVYHYDVYGFDKKVSMKLNAVQK